MLKKAMCFLFSFVLAAGVISAADVYASNAVTLNSYVYEKEKGAAFLVDIYTVSPNTLAIYIEDGWIDWAQMVPYEKQNGDKIRGDINYRNLTDYILNRGDKDIGYYVKDSAGNEFINLFETAHRNVLTFRSLRRTDNYALSSEEDKNFTAQVNPTAAHLKSKPVDYFANAWYNGEVIGHTVYLTFKDPLKEGYTYLLDFEKLGVEPMKGTFLYDSKTYISEAIHVGQVGFSVGSPQKRAFLSLWMGSGKNMKYDGNLRFDILDENDESRFNGEVKLTFPMKQHEKLSLSHDKNLNQTDVYTMDFSGFNEEGIFRVHIPGIGTSHPFTIGSNVWKDPFLTVMKGFYSQRSGIAMEEPYSSYTRPRGFHPDDGVAVYASTTTLLESGNGLNAFGEDEDNFMKLVSGKTNKIVEDAWGGYFDAGDWDRRIQHLDATRQHLEMLLLDKEYFGQVHLNIAESGNGLPDLLNEALWNIDCYRRMQLPDGGIRGGIESEEHPKLGETSWTNSLMNMAYAPDHWSGYIYAGVAARAAYVMEVYGVGEPEMYQKSAADAFAWSEREHKKFQSPGIQSKLTEGVNGNIDAERRLAAIELYRLTGEKAYHEIYRADFPVKNKNDALSVWNYYNVREALSVYLTLPEQLRDRSMYTLAREGMLREADDIAAYSQNNAFGLAHPEKWAHLAWGYYGAPYIQSLVRAHYYTGEEKYLKCLLGQMNFTTGANAVNTSFTTGIGNYPKTALVVDTRFTNQPPPPGLTLFGPWEPSLYRDYWIYKYFIDDIMYPPLDDWPAVDAYTPIYPFAPHSEYTINGTMGLTSYFFGYLAYVDNK